MDTPHLIRATAAAAVLLAALARPAAATFETASVTSDDIAAADDFGYGVALEGTTMAIGAPFADIGANANQGAVYIFEQVGGAWQQVQKLTAADGTANDLFGWSVAMSGDRLVVGAEEANVDFNDAQGAAYIFERTGGVWQQVHKLVESTAIQNQAEYGASVAMQGDWIVVGAPAAYSAQHGRAYVYHRDEGGPGAWGTIAELEDDIFDTNAGFGDSVALDGDLLVVGARLLDRVSGSFQNEGGAYVFRRDASNYWDQVGKLFRTGAQDNERAGSAVAIEGTRIVMGAYSVDGAGVSRGAAYVFENPTGTRDGWTQTAALAAGDAMDVAFFGSAVAMQDGQIWVGAHGHAASAGRAYRFEENLGGPGAWGQAEILEAIAPAANDWLGRALAVSGAQVAVGAFGAGTGGSVYLYPAPGGGASGVSDRAPRVTSAPRAQPNPFNPSTQLAFNLDAAGPVEVVVHDARGALVARLFRGELAAGDHALTWHAAGLPSGVYLATVRAAGSSRTTAVTLVR